MLYLRLQIQPKMHYAVSWSRSWGYHLKLRPLGLTKQPYSRSGSTSVPLWDPQPKEQDKTGKAEEGRRSGTINHHLKWQPRKKRLMNTRQCFTPSQYPALLLPQQKKLLHKHLLSQANRHISEFIARALHPKFKTSNKKKGSTWISSTPYWKYNRFLGGSPMLAATYNALCDLGPYYLRNCFCLCEILLQPRPTGMLSCGFMV